MVCTNHKSNLPGLGASLAPSGLEISFLFALRKKIIPQEEPFEANTFPAKPRTLKAQEAPGEEQCLSRQRVPRSTQCTAQGVVFLCCQGKTERISGAVLLPLLSCLPKAPSLESGPTCLPSVPGSLPQELMQL